MIRYFFFLCIVSLPFFSLQAQAPNPSPTLIPRSTLFAPADKADVQINPKGDKVSYRVGSEIYCVLTEKPDSAIRIDTDGPVSGYKWLPENQVVGVMQLEGKDRIFVSDLDNESPITVLPEEFDQARILAVSSTKIETCIAQLTFNDDEEKTGIYNVDLHYGRLKKLELPDSISRYWFDDELNPVAGSEPIGLYYDRVFYKGKQGEWTEVVSTDTTGIDTVGRTMQQIMSVNKEGSLLYVVNNFGQEYTVVRAINTRTGSSRIIKRAPNHDLLWAGAYPDNSTNTPQAVVGYYGNMKRYFLDNTPEVDFLMMEMTTTGGDMKETQKGDISYVGRSANDQFILIRIMDGGPLDYYLYNKATLKAEFLFSDHTDLDAYALADRSPYLVKARDGLELPCQLYLPPGSDSNKDGIPDEPLPTVLYVHGGPWVGFLNNSWFSNRNFQLLANRGYAVVIAEYRGATGYGRIFLEKSKNEWGEKMQEDLVDIVKDAKAKGIALEDRVAIWGWSYGGYATLASLAYYPEEYACGVGMYGVYDLKAFIDQLPPDETWWHRYVGDANTEDGKKLLKAHSPVFAADKIKQPLLLTHGGQDAVTPQSQTDAMYKALQGAGRKDIPYFVLPDEPHDYRKAESWEAFWAITEQFLATYLGGKYEKAGDDIENANIEMISGENWIRELK